MIKKRYACEKYTCAPLTKRQRTHCAQIRSGILPLHLQRSRYRGITEEELICIDCDLNESESEIDFVFYCLCILIKGYLKGVFELKVFASCFSLFKESVG